MTAALVSGMSLICPAGRTPAAAFRACLAGRASGADAGLPAPMNRVPLALLAPDDRLAELEARFGERSAALGVLAAREALADAGLAPTWMRRDRSALVVGTSKAGALGLLAAMDAVRGGAAAGEAAGSGTPRPLWPWGTPACVAGAVAEDLQPAGEVWSVVAACASGLAAVANGARLIAEGRADTVLVVAADATVHPLFIDSFWRLGVLATWSDEPRDACRPFSRGRCGFVLAEGAAAVVLQAPHSASALSDHRCVVRAWASGSLAADLVRPADGHQVQAAVLKSAMNRAGWPAKAVDLVHAHGTGTVAGDLAESRAIHMALGSQADQVPVISTKPITGHMLGAAGMAQAVLTVETLRNGLIPPTANLREPDPECTLDYNPAGPQRGDLRRATCLAAGFGGTVVALAIERQA